MLIHGWMMASGVFDPLVERLDGVGRLFRPDLRGAGASDAPHSGYTLATYVADLARWIRDQAAQGSAVIGHSMGGQLAQLLAVEHPDLVDRLILLNPVPAAGLPLPEEAHSLFASSAGDRERQGTILDMACIELPPRERRRLLDVAATVSPRAIRDSLEAWTAGGFADRLDRIDCQVDVVATSDPFLPATLLKEAVVDRIGGARLHQLDGPGHYPANEAPERAAALIRQLLTG